MESSVGGAGDDDDDVVLVVLLLVVRYVERHIYSVTPAVRSLLVLLSFSHSRRTCSEHERRTERVEVLRRKREKDVAKFSGHTDSDAYVVGGTRYSVVARRRVGDDKSWVTTL